MSYSSAAVSRFVFMLALLGCARELEPTTTGPAGRDAEIADVSFTLHRDACFGSDLAFQTWRSRAEVMTLSSGRYYLGAIAVDADCREVGRGCREIQLPRNGEVVVELSACTDCEVVSCPAIEDGGAADDAGVDARLDGATDTGRDASRDTGSDTPIDADESDCIQFVALGAGLETSCGIADDGSVYCWGNGSDGQLDGADTSSSRAVLVSGITASVLLGDDAIAVGEGHVCAITTTGQLMCWGQSANFATGQGGAAGTTFPPALVLASERFVQISTMEHVTCAITDADELYCFGGSRGDPGREMAASMSSFASVGVGSVHQCAVSSPPGSLYCRGNSASGRLGFNPDAGVDAGSPTIEMWTEVPSPAVTWERVVSGASDSCGLAADEIYCWGQSFGGAPPSIETERALSALSLGNAFACGVEGNELFCWGSDSCGQLGLPGSSTQATPVQVSGSYRSVAAGHQHTCALGSSGVARCWGDNDFGQAGIDGGAGTLDIEPGRCGLRVDLPGACVR